jgi:hypothetical protein
MVWPAPGEAMAELGYIVRYGTTEEVEEARLQVASIVDAYAELVHSTAAKRAYVIRELRKGPDQPARQSDVF